MKIVIAGGTGYIGRTLVETLGRAGHEVVVLSRTSSSGFAGARVVAWDPSAGGGGAAWTGELRGAGAAINLAGASIGGGRWTAARKRLLEESRLQGTGALVSAVRALEPASRPRVLLNASGIDYYGDRGDEVVTEESGPGDTYLAQLCVRWETTAREAEALGVRVVLMRTAVVFGTGADALARLALAFKLFAGGP
ncbi:MAG: NAD-dependent epimerase/dehydratase family protein, partial [Chloroflexota bacterium]